MEGWEAGGSELWAPFVSPSLTSSTTQTQRCQGSLLSANRQAACQPGRRCVRTCGVCVSVCVSQRETEIALVYEGNKWDSYVVESSI